MEKLIEVADLTKVYRDGTEAVHGVNFEVEAGEVFGFLGPNGAGKTTMIRILVTLLAKTSGTAKVAGFDVAREPEEVRRRIGYAAQLAAVDVDLTVRENLVLSARLQALPLRRARSRADEMIDAFALQEVAERRARLLSGGTRRRLDLAQALVHRPPLVFLDEPTTGLDPKTRVALWRHLDQLNEDGTTIFLTTQYLEEADQLCGRLAIVDRGGVVATGSPADLKHEIGEEVVTVTVDGGDGAVARAADALSRVAGAGAPRTFARSVAVPVSDAARAMADVVRRLDAVGVGVEEVAITRPTLDDVFLKHTGDRMPAEQAPTDPPADARDP